MTEEEAFNYLSVKYGERFTWTMILLSESTGYFVNELKKELGSEHELFDSDIYAVAKNGANDDVLFLIGSSIYRIYHLTYSAHNVPGFPRYTEFNGIEAVRDYLEEQILLNG